MTDREKVAFATKCRAEGSISYGLYADSKGICDKCPYKIGDGCDLEQILHDAHDLLKEQKAVEPFSDDDGGYWCGSCHEDIVWHQKFCSNCGRPVLWEGR